MVVFSEITAFLQLVEKATAWLDLAQERSRRRRTRTAARILYDAGVLVSGMRTYDNTYRGVLRRIRLLAPASKEEREAILVRLEEWNSIHQISPRVYQSFASLKADLEDGDTSVGLEELLPYAERIVERMKGIGMGKQRYLVQNHLQNRLRRAKTPEELKFAAEFAEEQLSRLDLGDLAARMKRSAALGRPFSRTTTCLLRPGQRSPRSHHASIALHGSALPMRLGQSGTETAHATFSHAVAVVPPRAEITVGTDDLGASPPDRWLRRRSVLLVVPSTSLVHTLAFSTKQ